MEWTDDQLDAHLDGTLPPGEQRRFDAALGADAALRDRLALHREVREVIEINALKAALDHIHRTAATAGGLPGAGAAVQPKTIARPLYRRRTWQAAAAAVLVGLGLALGVKLGGSGSSALYAKYYAPDAGLPGMMGGPAASYALDDAMVDYKQGRYDAAAEKLRGLRNDGMGGDTTAYYLGMAYLGAERYESAEGLLGPLSRRETVFRPKAAWYAALVALRLDRKEAAREALEAIARDGGNPKSAAARALLAEWK